MECDKWQDYFYNGKYATKIGSERGKKYDQRALSQSQTMYSTRDVKKVNEVSSLELRLSTRTIHIVKIEGVIRLSFASIHSSLGDPLSKMYSLFI